jgi:citrate/tricarballylate utilization protein
VGTLYHYLFGWVAPYGTFALPSVLGALGGLGLMVGPAGLFVLKRRAAASPVQTAAARKLDEGLLLLLFLTAATGLLLTALRDSDLLGVFLLVHLGVVMGLFLAMPYGKFIHGFYRILALVGYALEQRQGRQVMGAAPAAAPRRQAAE